MSTDRVLGVDAGSTTPRRAEHILATVRELLDLPSDAEGCTHLVRPANTTPHVAVSVVLPPRRDADLAVLPTDFGVVLDGDRRGPHERTAGAAAAATERGDRRGGRAVTFRGSEMLRGSLRVREVVARTVIDEVTVVGGGPAAPDAVLHTGDFVRPVWRDGRLILAAVPRAGGTLAPFEVADPHQCCGIASRTPAPCSRWPEAPRPRSSSVPRQARKACR